MRNQAHNANYTTCYRATSSCHKSDMSTNGSSSIESSIRSLPAHPHQPTSVSQKRSRQENLGKEKLSTFLVYKMALHGRPGCSITFYMCQSKFRKENSLIIECWFSLYLYWIFQLEGCYSEIRKSCIKRHEEAVLKTITLPSQCRNIAKSLSAQAAKDRLDRRQCFLKILSSIKFLAQLGLPLRGHGDKADSSFMQLIKLRGWCKNFNLDTAKNR